MRLYVRSASVSHTVSVLEREGVGLVNRGFADDISAALDFAFNASAQRTPSLEGVAGLVAISRGRFDEGERLLVRAVKGEMSPSQRAEFLLPLAIHQSNRGNEPVALLESFVVEPELDSKNRLEAQSFLAYSYARSGRGEDADALASAVQAEVEALHDDSSQARIMLRLGNIALLRSQPKESRPLLVRAAEIAAREALWGTASRAYRSLSLQALMVDSDTAESLWFAQQASAAATRAGDYYDLQMSLLSILSIETRRGNAERAQQVERQLVELNKSDASTSNYILSGQAHRNAWSRQFADAHRIFGTIKGRQPHTADRVFIAAAYSLCLALDGQTKPSATAAAEVLAEIATSGDEKNVLFDFAELFVALAEVVCGRFTAAAKMLKRSAYSHPGAEAFAAAVNEALQVARSAGYEATDFQTHVDTVISFGFGGYARYLTLGLEVLEQQRVPEEAVNLTPSELTILRALAEGRTPKEIAADMGRSVLTVQTHVQNIIRKLGGNGRSGAIATARRMGFL